MNKCSSAMRDAVLAAIKPAKMMLGVNIVTNELQPNECAIQQSECAQSSSATIQVQVSQDLEVKKANRVRRSIHLI